MESLFAAIKTGSVEEVKKVLKETDISLTVCNEVYVRKRSIQRNLNMQPCIQLCTNIQLPYILTQQMNILCSTLLLYMAKELWFITAWGGHIYESSSCIAVCSDLRIQSKLQVFWIFMQDVSYLAGGLTSTYTVARQLSCCY